MVLLEGVRIRGAVSPRQSKLLLASAGKVAYRVVEPQQRNSRPNTLNEKRTGARRRSHLRSAKILDEANEFVCECQIVDRSASGCRLKLARNVGVAKSFRLFDDETSEIFIFSLVWRRDCVIGARRCGRVDSKFIKEATRVALKSKFYAIRD